MACAGLEILCYNYALVIQCLCLYCPDVIGKFEMNTEWYGKISFIIVYSVDAFIKTKWKMA